MEERKIVINDRFLSIPPHLSAAWRDIVSVYMKGDNLHLTLKDGEVIILKDLPESVTDSIFFHHALFLERKSQEKHKETMDGLAKPLILQGSDLNDPLIKIGLSLGSFDMGVGQMMEHSPEQKDMPPLPPEVLEKITLVVKTLLPVEEDLLPKPEENCRCFYCQIVGALQQQDPETIEPETEEEIPLSELSFSDWEIEPKGHSLYAVMNKLNPEERYSVFLGTPLGCTCGRPNCEHIVAVLKS